MQIAGGKEWGERGERGGQRIYANRGRVSKGKPNIYKLGKEIAKVLKQRQVDENRWREYLANAWKWGKGERSELIQIGVWGKQTYANWWRYKHRKRMKTEELGRGKANVCI